MPESYEDIQNNIDDYQQTVGSILAFSNILEHDYGFKSLIGKKLFTSPHNEISPSDSVTPDIVSKNDNFGIVTEVNKGFPSDMSLWEQDIKQVKKYDDDLKGWINKDDSISNHDIVLMTHHSRSNKLSKFVTELIREGKITFKRKLSIIEFVRNSERQTFYNIKKIYGEMTNDDMQTRLEDCIPVNTIYLFKKLAKIRFYDAEPHIVLMMSILWDHYISKKPTDEERREFARTNKTMFIRVNVDEAHKDLMEKVGLLQEETLQCEVPKRDWIVKALDKFVELKHGKKIDSNNYEIKFLRYKNMDDSIKFFAEEITKDLNDNLTKFIEQKPTITPK